MKVKELIEQLKNMDPESIVYRVDDVCDPNYDVDDTYYGYEKYPIVRKIKVDRYIVLKLTYDACLKT